MQDGFLAHDELRLAHRFQIIRFRHGLHEPADAALQRIDVLGSQTQGAGVLRISPALGWAMGLPRERFGGQTLG